MMKYEALALLHSHLLKQYSKQTARVYLSKLDALLLGQDPINTITNFDMEMVLINLSKIKYKNPFSQAKNALLLFCSCHNIIISSCHQNEIDQLEGLTKRKYRKMKPVSFENIKATIDRLKNPKLKLSFQALYKTGLRVSELAQITPNDCHVSDDMIQLSFIGKGGNRENTTLTNNDDDAVFFERLVSMIKATKQADKVFYSAIYLQEKAKKYGFTCRDLRRAYAKLEYQKTKSKIHVKEKLRHSSIKSTNIYLKSKVSVRKRGNKPK